MANLNHDLMPCHTCQNHFPSSGLERPLSVQIGHLDHSQLIFLCIQCRRNLFETQPELYPPKVEAYMDAIFGAQIVPRITALEAGLHYFLGEPHLQELPYDDVSFVGEDNVTYQLRLFQEKLVLDKARQEYGGDVGIANARRVFAVPGEQDQLPPVGVIRERRNIIREAFLKIGIFAAPELNFVRRFVERSEGDLHQLVNLYGP